MRLLHAEGGLRPRVRVPGREELLTFEEIERIARIFVAGGVEKIRITGGEPLVRRELPVLVAKLAALGDVDLTLTTNGALLARQAEDLADAGLTRVTVSLDSLDDDVFRAMNDVDFPVARVLEGIEAAAAAGLAREGQRRRQTRAQRRLDSRSGAPLQGRRPHASLHRVHGRRAHERLEARRRRARRGARRLHRRRAAARAGRAFVSGRGAQRYRYRDGSGEIGVISSVTQPFCGDCTRARLSADGKLYTCLFAVRGHDLRGLVRSGATDGELADAIAGVWAKREDRYSELRSAETVDLPKVEMSFIGG